MYVAALRVELHIPHSTSLKAKRSVVRHLVEASHHRFGVSACEVAEHERHQSAVLGFSIVAPDPGFAGRLLDRTERFVWSHPDIEVVQASRHWLEIEGDR
jgi:uncharacterized protein